jgi:hypothetical protein
MPIRRLTIAGESPGWQLTGLTWQMLIHRIDTSGAKVRGEGTFSFVYDNPRSTTQVIKVSKVHRNGNALLWLEWCSKNPSSYVPKVYSIERFQGPENQKYFVATMEKLTGGHPTKKEMESFCLAHNIKDNFPYQRISEMVLTPTNVTDTKAYPDLSRVIKAIVYISNNDRHWQDINATNIFIRGSDLVFVDPLTGGDL